MRDNLVQPQGSTSTVINKESIARIFNINEEEVGYLKKGEELTGIKILFDNDTKSTWYNLASGTIVSWSLSESGYSVVTDKGSFNIVPIDGNFMTDYGDNLIILNGMGVFKDGKKYILKYGIGSYTTTGSWDDDRNYFEPFITFSEIAEFFSGNDFSNQTNKVVSKMFDIQPNLVDFWGLAGIRFGGGKNAGEIVIDEKGRIKTNSYNDGVKANGNLMFPTVENIYAETDNFPVKIVRFPSDKFESDWHSPSFIIDYDTNGLPRLFLQNPDQFSNGYGYPKTGENITWREVAYKNQLDSLSGNYKIMTSSTTVNSYIKIATWNTSSVMWNSELVVEVIGGATDGPGVPSYTVTANPQKLGKLSSSPALFDLSNSTKILYNGESIRTYGDIGTNDYQQLYFGYVYNSDGTISLWCKVDGKVSTVAVKLNFISNNPPTLDYVTTPITTTAPSNLVLLPTQHEYTSFNSSVANNGSIVIADRHARLTLSSGTSTREDITRDGFIWAGYGTVKHGNETIAIANPSTGVYTISNAYIPGAGQWNVIPPFSTVGEQLATVEISSSGSVITVNVFSIVYSATSTLSSDGKTVTTTVTKTKGSLMNIPDNTWVDVNLKNY